MNLPIRAADFSVRSWPPEARMVAVLSANFDDSQDGKGEDLWVLAGYVGYKNQWDFFEERWQAALARHGVPYFHMIEMPEKDGPFAKWLPPKEHQDEVREFFKDLVGAIIGPMLFMTSSAVWIKDLERFNQETGLNIEAYPLIAYTCMMNMAIQYPGLPITAVFDRADQVQSKLDTARAYAEADERLVDAFDRIATFPLQKGLTVREVPAIQAADLIVWELRKEHHKMKQWQQSERPVLTDRVKQWQSYMEWSRETRGSDPILRKSLEALIQDTKRIRGMVWDYQQLTNAIEAKGGLLSHFGAKK